MVQPRDRVREPDAAAGLRVEARSAVAKRDREVPVAKSGLDPDGAVAAYAVDAVLDRVLHQRLKEEVRDRDRHRVGLNADLDGQAIAEADPHDVDIALEQGELVGERHLFDLPAFEGEAQQVAEPRDHVVGRVDVAVHQRRDPVQRVEQEVRLQLHAQRFELRAREGGFE
jgi:hypothetical protein